MSRFADIDIDPAIVRRAAGGDARAHEIIYRSFRTPVYSLCLRFTRVPAHAEDLTQDTFMEVMRSIDSFRGDAPLGSWIRRVAVSKALMFLRSAWQQRGQTLDDEQPYGHAAADGPQTAPEAVLDIDAALAGLPALSRAVVWLHDVEGLTHKEIAALTGRTESFSKSRLARAYRHLRPVLEQGLREEDAGTAAVSTLPEPC